MNKFRRVVTGHGSDRKSKVIIDGTADTFIDMGSNCGVTEMWATYGPFPSNEGADDAALRSPSARTPPPGGDKFRIIEFAPDEKVDLEEADRRLAGRIRDGKMQGSTKGHLHRTETVDYAIVLKGEICHITESDEIVLRQGDVLIQRGTYHAWRNRSKESVLLAVILMDAQPLARVSA